MMRVRTTRSWAMPAAAIGALAAGGAAGCGGDYPYDALTPITGTYVLETVDGAELPILVDDGGDAGPRVELIAGILLLERDGDFTVATDYRVTQGAEVSFASESVSGEWTADVSTGTTVSFFPDSAGIADFTGVVSRDRITLAYRGETWVVGR
jgi:hypothetical protein